MNTEVSPTQTEILNDPRVDLAVERTELALERTHLAWVRTTLTIISAGLAIDAASSMIHLERVKNNVALVNNGHVIGIVMTSCGIFLLSIETLFFLRRNRQLALMKKAKAGYLSPASGLSIFVLLLGFFLATMMFIFG